ncbi:DUF2973 domain-containing protein [Pseudanabaena sp. FACHB-2040]|uniref:DUF2973 domain-containing protein n=1 Tax=Pseudanabaena sp. FACHB-2040 TaxID=2692859 RepID=UPI001686D7E7|nr:DUF2973 domain-containing protein [Pseudanabaena sp. FACHB-2040]MBD0267378.1 DUF2973 domain-containing protein [Cyanobacteria bacterium Co-bin8]MBD2260162.1 DUF2973 domain-containing protein [Pseudanabaena sp. FACHB-2040]
MWHFLYIVAFAVLAFLAIGNLIRNLILLGSDARRPGQGNAAGGGIRSGLSARPVPHPELLDDQGNMIREPLLVMRSISVRDAREQLDALFDSSDSEDGSSDRQTDKDI